MKKRKLALPILAAGTIAFSGLFLSLDYQNSQSKKGQIINQLIKKLQVKNSQPKALIKKSNEQIESDFHLNFASRLEQALNDGVINHSQADSIMEKTADLNAQLLTIQEYTPQEQIKTVALLRKDIENWGTSNGIQLSTYLSGPFNQLA